METRHDKSSRIICRTCRGRNRYEYRTLSSPVEVILYDAEPEVCTVLDCLRYCLQSQTPPQSSELPELICTECFDSLFRCYVFLKMAKQSEEKFLATAQVESEYNDVVMQEIHGMKALCDRPEQIDHMGCLPKEENSHTWLDVNDTNFMQSPNEVVDDATKLQRLSRFRCQLCRYESTSICDMYGHYILSHKRQPKLDQLKRTYEARRSLKCKLYPNRYNAARKLKRHNKNKHHAQSPKKLQWRGRKNMMSGFPLLCEFCAYEAPYGSHLEHHYTVVHKIPPDGKQLKGKYFDKYQTLKSIWEGSCLPPYQCGLCTYETTFYSCLKRHYVRSHNLQPTAEQLKRICCIAGLNPYKSEVCKFECRLLCNLEWHYKRIHRILPKFDMLKRATLSNLDEAAKVEEIANLERVDCEPEETSNYQIIYSMPEINDKSNEGDTIDGQNDSYETNTAQVLIENEHIENSQYFAEQQPTAEQLAIRYPDAYNDSIPIENVQYLLPYQRTLPTYGSVLPCDLQSHNFGKHDVEPTAVQLCQKESTAGLSPYQREFECNLSSNLKLHNLEPTEKQLQRKKYGDDSIQGDDDHLKKEMKEDFYGNKLCTPSSHATVSTVEVEQENFIYSQEFENKPENNIQPTPEQLPLTEPAALQTVDNCWRQVYICCLCRKLFATRSLLENHSVEHKDLKPINCEVCNYECRYQSNMAWHCENQHGCHKSDRFEQFGSSNSCNELAVDGEVIPLFEPEVPNDKICDEIIEIVNGIIPEQQLGHDHVLVPANTSNGNSTEQCEDKDKPSRPVRQCQMCNYNTKIKFNLERHYVCKHGISPTPQQLQGNTSTEEVDSWTNTSLKHSFQCEECLLKFRTGLLLECHLATHKDTEKIICNLCRYQCYYQGNMVRHFRLKHNIGATEYPSAVLKQRIKEEANLLCSKCSKRFMNQGTLEAHGRVCTHGSKNPEEHNQKPFKCTKCPSRFYYPLK